MEVITILFYTAVYINSEALPASQAYVLLEHLRRVGLGDTSHGRAQVSTIRLRLLKIAARVVVSVRRIVFHLASSCPDRHLFRTVVARLVPK